MSTIDPMDQVPDDVRQRLHLMAAGLQRLAACVSKRKIYSFRVHVLPDCEPDQDDIALTVVLPGHYQASCTLGDTEDHMVKLNDLLGQCVELPIGGVE